ncbi:MAG: hypothetical protein ABIH04_03310 [Planctomycetota bacterium]
MAIKREHNLFVVLLATFFLMAAHVAVATPVTPIYEITGFGDFGPVVGGPLATNFGGGMFELTGTLTSTVYRADEAFELNQGEDTAYVDVDDLTFVYRIDAAGMVNINYLQINLPLGISSETIVAVGWNSTVSDETLTLVDTEIDFNYQIEFGDDIGGSSDAFGLDPGETIEVFITFEDLDYSLTTALLDGGGFPVSGVEVLGADLPEMPEPASIGTALAALLGLCGIIAHRCKK